MTAPHQLDFITLRAQQQQAAAARLARTVEQTRESFPIRDFARRRGAMLKHSRQRQAATG